MSLAILYLRQRVQIQLQCELVKETLGWSDEAVHTHSQKVFHFLEISPV